MTGPEELTYHIRQTAEALGRGQARVRLPHPWRLAPGPWEGHFHLRAELFLQRGGSTRFTFPDEVLDLGPGEILVVPPRLPHAETISAGPTPFRNVVLYADEAALACHLADQGPGGGPQIAVPEHRSGGACRQVAAWLEDAVTVARDLDGAPEVVAGLVQSCLAVTLRLLDRAPEAGGAEPITVVRCRRMVHEDLGNPELSVASLARRLGCSADYLSHLFRSVRQEKLTTYIEEQRMARAAELLGQSSLSVKEVAWASGYANQSYFIRCFRRRWGTSPGDWRNAPPLTALQKGRFDLS